MSSIQKNTIKGNIQIINKINFHIKKVWTPSKRQDIQNSLYAAAISIGSANIVILHGKRNENKNLEIAGYSRSDSKGIKRGEVFYPEKVTYAVRDAVSELQHRTGIRLSGVFAGINGHHLRIIKYHNCIKRESDNDYITIEEVEQFERDAAKVVRDEGQEIICILSHNFIVDDETDIINPVGMLGCRLCANFSLLVYNIHSVERIKKCIQHAGLTLSAIIPEPLATSEAVLHDEERRAGVALVDIGGGNTNVAIFHDDVLRHLANIPYAGIAVTRDIRWGLNEQLAEDLKLRYGVAMSDAAEKDKVILLPRQLPRREPKEISIYYLALVIEARMEEIIDAVMQSIEYSGYAGRLGCGMVITGGGAMLPRLKELIHTRTGMKVRIGCAGDRLTGIADELNQPCYAPVVGLLMKSFDDRNSQHEEALADEKYFE